jgi:nucleotide-binding universal stress UspA family protein
MYQHILLAVALQKWEKFGPHALAAREAAVALAKGSGAKLSVLSVYEYGKLEESGLPAEMAARYREDLMRRIDAEMESKMKAFLAGADALDLAVTPLLKPGDPRKLITATAESVGADLIVIGAHSKRSILDVLLGGTAAYVSRHAPCSVIMVQSSPGEKPQTSAAG